MDEVTIDKLLDGIAVERDRVLIRTLCYDTGVGEVVAIHEITERFDIVISDLI